MADVYHPITTKRGTFTLKPTERDHIYADGHATVRGKRQRLSAHFHLWNDGKWRLGREDKKDWERKREAYFDGGGATTAFFNDAIPDLEGGVNEWAAANQAAIAEAEQEYKERGIANRLDQISRHEKALVALKREVRQLQAGEHLSCYSDVPSYDGPREPLEQEAE
jgi:hypothetical protein